MWRVPMLIKIYHFLDPNPFWEDPLLFIGKYEGGSKLQI